MGEPAYATMKVGLQGYDGMKSVAMAHVSDPSVIVRFGGSERPQCGSGDTRDDSERSSDEMTSGWIATGKGTGTACGARVECASRIASILHTAGKSRAAEGPSVSGKRVLQAHFNTSALKDKRGEQCGDWRHKGRSTPNAGHCDRGF